mgnify:FL=1|jgi:hypothetical protein
MMLEKGLEKDKIEAEALSEKKEAILMKIITYQCQTNNLN